MIKARLFLLITGAIFGTLFMWKTVQRGYVFEDKKPKKSMEFRLTKEEKPFVLIIPSYNNEEYVDKNLWSVLDQEYQNYRVIFIDDCSNDATYKEAISCVESFEATDKVTVIRNPENYKALYNLYYTIQSLPDDTIVVILDGDDWFAHPRVLKELNRYYSDPNIWMTYSQYITYPKYEKGKMLPVNVKKKNLRGQTFFPSLRTFYAGLFKKIKLKDLLYKGGFFQASWDAAVMLPLWEMARQHSVFIPDVLYVYNRETPLNDDKLYKESQFLFNRYIRSLPPYEDVDSFSTDIAYDESSALIIFSENRPLQLLSFLESLEKAGGQFSPIHIFYQSSFDAYEKGYDIVREAYDQKVTLEPWSSEENFLNTIRKIERPYITFAKDTLIVNREINVGEAISALEKTGAYAVYFDLGLNVNQIPAGVLSAGDGFFVWDFGQGDNEWKCCNRLDMTLYRKESLEPFISKIHFNTISEFEARWKKCTDLHQIGLFSRQSNVVNVPFQITKIDSGEKSLLYSEEELNDRLLEGYKIDIAPLENLEVTTREIEFYPHFLKRSESTD